IEKEKRFVELRGDKAGLRWNDDGTADIFTEDADGTLIDIRPRLGEMGNGHSRALEHFATICLDGVEKDYTPEQGVNMIRILEAMYQSAATGREVRLD
ncbi:MAG: gfo/Idh/MocA family oxidoreductase, partial [Clostridia bacterium]|nr:gfo/Idh/MocA family oxidoreductase [Clostridia bacterium]